MAQFKIDFCNVDNKVVETLVVTGRRHSEDGCYVNYYVAKPESFEEGVKEHCNIEDVEVYSVEKFDKNKESIERNCTLENVASDRYVADYSSSRNLVSREIDDKVCESRRKMAEYVIELQITTQ